MAITPRMKQILQVLLREEKPISIKYLAEQVGISKRTVQRELEYIDDALIAYNLKFASKTGLGVWLDGDNEARMKLLTDITKGDNYDVSNKGERRKRLILEILKEKGMRKLYYYSKKFGVSEATVSTDLEAVEKWLSKQGLQLIRKPGSGIEVEGSEEDYRRAIRFFIGENINTRLINTYGDDKSDNYYESMKKSHLGNLLDNDIVNRVQECLDGIENERMDNFTENAYEGLIIHLSIAINRILHNDMIQDDRKWQDKTDDDDYALAQEIAQELEAEFEVELPPLEIAYICLHIKGAKHERLKWQNGNKEEIAGKELKRFINELIDAYDPQQAYLLKQDEEFMQGLLAHLQPTIVRLVHGMSIQNPVLDDIKQNYTDIFVRCQKVAEVLEKKIGKKVPEEEIGFLTVHFGAAIVRMEERQAHVRKVNAAVVCSSGIGLSRLMAVKLNKVFMDRVELTTYGKHDITPEVEQKMDFIVSSLPLENVNIPVVYVNPLLSDANIDEIRHMVYKYERMPKKTAPQDSFSEQLDAVNLMAQQINSILKHLKCFRIKADTTFDELLYAIGDYLGSRPEQKEMIVDAIAKREEISSQIFAEFGFGLLHTRTRGVNRPRFAVCVPDNGETFTDSYLKNVRLIFVMLVPLDENAKVNTEIFGHISSVIIEDEEFMDIAAEGDISSFRATVSRHLNKFFKNYLDAFK